MTSNIRVFPAGTKFYLVSGRHSVNEKKEVFDDPARALLWAVLTDPNLKPEPLTAEENIAQVMAKSLHERLVRKARFPLNSEYILAELVNPLDVRYIAEIIPNEMFEEADRAGKSAAGFFHRVAPSFIKTGFVSVYNDGSINIDQTYENLANLRHEQLLPLDTITIRITGASPFVHQKSFSIDWERLWRLLLDALKRHGSGNLGAIKGEIDAIIKNRQLSGQILTGEAPPGYDDCFDALIGPFNQALNSCFMDSTLICLFGFKNSPFYQKLVVEDVNTNSRFTVCSNDRGRDRLIREEIQRLLREDVAILMAGGKRFHCTNLRNVLGRLCTKEGNLDDLSQGTHDPYQLYGRLVEALNYSPMTIRTVTYRARDEQGTDEIMTTEDLRDVESLPSLRAGDPTIYAAAWPYSWQTEYDELASRSAAGRPFLKTVRQIVRADAIVVYIDRSIAAEEEAPTQTSAASTNLLLTMFEGTFAAPESEVEGVPAGQWRGRRDEAAVNPRPIVVDPEIDTNGILYTLKGVVFSPFNGHYAALLHCGNSWFMFDDLRADQPISRTPIDENEAAVLINTRGTLFFYYPTFMSRGASLNPPRPVLAGQTLSPVVTPMQNLTLGGKK